MKTACLALCLIAAAPAAALAGDLRAELVGGPRDGDGRLELAVPSDRAIGLALRLTNTGTEPAEVVLSNYPAFLHAKLSISRIGPDGNRTGIEPYWDLYPLKDMKAPMDVTHTLAPGESVERSCDVLLFEGYLLGTFAQWGRMRYPGLREKGFGALREPGEYEIVGTYVADAETKADPIRTAPLRAVVHWRFRWDDAARRTARADAIVTGTVIEVPYEGPPAPDGRLYTYRVVDGETLAGKPGDHPWFRVHRSPRRSGPAVEGRRLLFLVRADEGWFLVDDGSAPEATEEEVADARERISFFDTMAIDPLSLDPGTATAVGKLVDEMTDTPASQRAALKALERLGEKIVPALVAHLGDERKLADPNVIFGPNERDDFFTRLHWYRPGVAGKAIERLLNQITGEDLEGEHDWRIYARCVAAGAR